MQCLKVHHALSSLLIHSRFDDVTRLRGWNKFQGLRVESSLQLTNHPHFEGFVWITSHFWSLTLPGVRVRASDTCIQVEMDKDKVF